ncbi:MAG: intradiol ring-cleavage dioxygenase [bacterium]
MDNDDLPVGRILKRREILSLFGAAGAAMIAAACSPNSSSNSTSTASATSTTGTAGNGNSGAAVSQATAGQTSAPTAATAAASAQAISCVVTPELTEGPYFVDEKLNRSDIRTDSVSNKASAGTPLLLSVGVFQASSTQCIPLANAQVDVWHCDAAGVYSDVSGNTEDFLRGYQVTDSSGQAKFTTVYPGWYQGRAVHIHFKVRLQKDGKNYEFTSQWFFDEAMNDAAYTVAPYSSRGKRTTMNANDSIFRQSGGQLTLAPTKSGNGYAAPFNIAIKI